MSSLGGSEYIKVSKLGQGAFGIAILYRRVADDVLVVVKEFDLGRMGEKVRRDALREADVLRKLSHPNIIAYFDTFEDKGLLMIEMEYADGGTLRDKIVEAGQTHFAEPEIVWYSFQLLQALQHIHENNIIHRDIKSENIFLTKSGIVKLGDFGISKVIDEHIKAQTTVGTPYYMSPEVLQGQPYDSKTDIFSSGCVMHELCNLVRTFQSTNLPALVYKIVRGNFAPVDTMYSEGLRDLVHEMLASNQKNRPTALRALQNPIFHGYQEKFDAKFLRVARTISSARSDSVASEEPSTPGRNVFATKESQVYAWGSSRPLQAIEPFTEELKAFCVATSGAHSAVATMGMALYTWSLPGDPSGRDGYSCGQLGHGAKSSLRAPKAITGLAKEHVASVGCGSDFTICLTEDGRLYGFGSNDEGALGVEQGEDTQYSDVSVACTPILLPLFTTRTVSAFSVGERHVLALTSEAEVYSWGYGEHGRLGNGDEDTRFAPCPVRIKATIRVVAITAGIDGSFLLGQDGTAYACGNNEHNKLGLNMVGGVLSMRKNAKFSSQGEEYGMELGEVVTALLPRPVQSLRGKQIRSIATGLSHSAAIDVAGRLFTFGLNSSGQLGAGNFKAIRSSVLVKGELTGKKVTKVACGDAFTVVGTDDDLVLSWGCGANNRLGNGSAGNRALPRPVFGSLYRLADLACRNQQTILIAERVVSTHHMDRFELPPLAEVTEKDSVPSIDISSEVEPSQDGSDLGESGQPGISAANKEEQSDSDDDSDCPWLMEEFSKAPVIPMKRPEAPPSVVPKEDTQMLSQTDAVPDWLKNELAMAPIIPIAHSTSLDSTQSLPARAGDHAKARAGNHARASAGVNDDEAGTCANAAIRSSEGNLTAQPSPDIVASGNDSRDLSASMPAEPGMAGVYGKSSTLPDHMPDRDASNPSHAHLDTIQELHQIIRRQEAQIATLVTQNKMYIETIGELREFITSLP